MFQSHQRKTRFPIIWNYLHHCSFFFWIIKVSCIMPKKYGITHDLNHNTNLTKGKKPLYSSEDKLRNGAKTSKALDSTQLQVVELRHTSLSALSLDTLLVVLSWAIFLETLNNVTCIKCPLQG